MMLDDKTEEKHPSYGLVGIFRTTCSGGANLFGSSIKHHQTIRLRIKEATKNRALGRDWYSGGGQIIEIELSPTQYAEMISSHNMGEGVPCTLLWRQGVGRIEDCPETNQREVVEKEFEKGIHELYKKATDLLNEAHTILKSKTMKASDRDVLLEKITTIHREIKANVPFAHSQFNEAMDKTVSACKGEVEAFVENKISSLGMEAWRNQLEHATPEIKESRMLEGVVVTDLVEEQCMCKANDCGRKDCIGQCGCRVCYQDNQQFLARSKK